MIELTEQQRHELPGNGGHAVVRDPATCVEYVLLRADIFARVRELVEQAEDEILQEAWADAVEEARSELASE